jgi:hypothetical protein
VAIEFNQYQYYPCLQCSEPEHIGCRELSDEDKDAILPIIELSQTKMRRLLEIRFNRSKDFSLRDHSS